MEMKHAQIFCVNMDRNSRSINILIALKALRRRFVSKNWLKILSLLDVVSRLFRQRAVRLLKTNKGINAFGNVTKRKFTNCFYLLVSPTIKFSFPSSCFFGFTRKRIQFNDESCGQSWNTTFLQLVRLIEWWICLLFLLRLKT